MLRLNHVSLLAALVTVLAWTTGIVYADPLQDVDIKWSQLPDMTVRGFDYSSQRWLPRYLTDPLAESRVAEDFQCTSYRPVASIHWWGSLWQVTSGPPTTYSNYWPDPSLVPPQGNNPGYADLAFMRQQISGFEVRFYTDVPMGVDPAIPYSHPGQELTSYTQFIPMSLVLTNLHGIIHRLGPSNVVGDPGDEAVWQYTLPLDEPFDQVLGNWYWLSIQAITSEETQVQYGWHQSVELVHDNAVQNGTARQWGLIYGLEWVLLPDVDMAFELTDTKVPEPATLSLLGLGGILAYLRRKKA